jgi:lipopolysaccharide export system permease protein
MRLLDRYLLRELLLPLGYCLGGFLIFWISFDLLNEFNRFQRSNLGFADVIEFYFVTTPELLLVVMPVALLLALLYSLTTHARHNELTAMRAAGISLWRFSAPYFAVGLFFSITYFVINEFWVPDSTDRAEAIMHRHDDKQTNAIATEWRRDLKFKNFRDNRDWAISAYNLKNSQLQGVLVEQTFPDGRREVISAKRGEFSGGVWKFYDAEKNLYKSVQDIVGQNFSTNVLIISDWPETPELIRSEIKISGLTSKRAERERD